MISPTRNRLSLNGEWQIATLADGQRPETLTSAITWESEPFLVPSSWRWTDKPAAPLQPFDLFDYPRHWNEAKGALLRRTFIYKPALDERLWLVLHGILQSWAIFVNGRCLHHSQESFLPTQLDITDFTQPGENELVIWCGSWSRLSTPNGSKLLVPSGSWFADLARGPWQDVILESRPPVWLADVVVRTSVRNGRIAITATLENCGERPFQGEIQAVVRDGETAVSTAVKQLPPASISLLAGETTSQTWEEAWPDATYWSPENPHLYQLEVTLHHNGLIDQTNTRFGFREIWFEGPDCYLNGLRLNLRGDAWHYQGFVYQTAAYARNWYRVCRAAGLNFVRLHAMPYPEFFLDVADEEGMLIINESAIYGSSKMTQSDHPEFITNCRDHLAALVRRDRNHASVIIWSMQNEMRWVDGREGYREAMPALTAVIRQLDPTRPIGYDGDNRLVPADWCDLLSMHYNIDGTIADWDRSKPLIFGEHGAYHYISPQVASHLAGPEAYLSYEAALVGISQWEALFIAYARRQGVTGVTPFNLVYYAHWTLPDADQRPVWSDLSAPGPKPRRIPAHSLSVNNGLVNAPLSRPNPAYAPLHDVCQPVTLLPDELNRRFYAGTVTRTFSLYNDTETTAEAQLRWRLSRLEEVVDEGEWSFSHPPGMRVVWQQCFDLPPGELSLAVELAHGRTLRQQQTFSYQADDLALKQAPISTNGKRLGYVGELGELATLLPTAVALPELTTEILAEVDVLIIAPFYRGIAVEIAALLGQFVENGKVLLVLEQDQFTLGELTLSARTFFTAFANPPDHPVFAGLNAADLCFWTADNPHAPGWQGLVNNAFHKPVQGDLEILLECGQGDFGWGGLLWTPLLAYRHGAGRVVCCQLALQGHWQMVPQAAILFRNLVTYCVQGTGNSLAQEPIIVDPEALDDDLVEELRGALGNGRTLLIQAAFPHHQPYLQQLAGVPMQLVAVETYQLANLANQAGSPTRGMTAYDLTGLDRATYTPPTYQNQVVARFALDLPGAEPLLAQPHNPWTAFFVQGQDGESVKTAVATRQQQAQPTPHVYAARLPVGPGEIIFWQVIIDPQSAKGTRLFNRLLGNLGAAVKTHLFDQQKTAADHGLEAMMGLPQAAHHSFAALRDYFTSPTYTLNHLGEGVFGWMKRLEKQQDGLTIPQSARQTWFLTAFVISAINRDPSQREAGALPDSSIVPNLYLTLNCAGSLFVNGGCVWETAVTPTLTIKIEDVLLKKGINRLALICQAAEEDIRLNIWFVNKHGEPLPDLLTVLTLD